ncbi:MAG: B12-binding domain-containing radical SAM protein, partial [Gemmatimonadota bacterium]
MDILLTHGYYLHEDPKEQEIMRPYPPLGILYISAHLKRCGFEVGIFDATFRTREEFREVLERERPSVVGLYVTMMTRASVLRAVQDCRAIGATVVVGGPDPANYAAEYLDRGVDVVVIGEGELTLEELLPHLAKRGPNGMHEIQGIAFRDGDGKLVHTPARSYIDDLDAQPFPDRESIDIGEYIRVWREHHGMGSVSLITARGCPYTCKWCSHAVFGYTHRRRSVENVVEEVELILDRYEPDMLWYADDVFTIHRRWFQGYHEALKERGIKIPFETISREDRLNEDVVRRLAEMG